MQNIIATLPADTTDAAAQVQIKSLRGMGLAGRVELTFQLCDHLRTITREGIRYRHPEYTDRQVTEAYLKMILEEAMFRQMFPDSEITA